MLVKTQERGFLEFIKDVRTVSLIKTNKHYMNLPEQQCQERRQVQPKLVCESRRTAMIPKEQRKQ